MTEKQSEIVYCFQNGTMGNNVCMSAVVERDGKLIGVGGHVSSNLGWGFRDITAPHHQEGFKEACPNGYTVEKVENPQDHHILKKYWNKKKETEEDDQ